MARAIICAGLLATSAMQCLADPILDASSQTVGDWESVSVEGQRAAAASFAASMKDPKHVEGSIGTRGLPRMMEPEIIQQSSVQEILDILVKEFHSIFKTSPIIPKWDNSDYATETVKQIVERVRERLSNITPGDIQDTRGDQTTSTIRGLTSEFLRELMVQEAASESLWALFRDSQTRPWIEHHAQQAAATQATNGFLNRMHERLRMVGFSQDDVTRLLPRATGGLNCGREGPGGLYETCPERNMGKKHRGSHTGTPGVSGAYPSTVYPSYGYPSYGYPGYGYPSYSYPSYGYPSYGHPSYGYPSYGHPSYGYPSYGYPSYGYPISDISCCGDCGSYSGNCGATTYMRRLGAAENTREPVFPSALPLLFPADQAAHTQADPGALPRGGVDGILGIDSRHSLPIGSLPPYPGAGVFGGMAAMDEPRNISHYYRWGQGRPLLGYYELPSWGSTHVRPPFSFGYPTWGYSSRRLDVPDITAPVTAAPVAEPQTLKTVPRSRSTAAPTMQQQTPTRAGGVRASLANYDILPSSGTLESLGATYYREQQPMMEPTQGLWTS